MPANTAYSCRDLVAIHKWGFNEYSILLLVYHDKLTVILEYFKYYALLE